MSEQANVGRLSLDVVADVRGLRAKLKTQLDAELKGLKAQIKAEIDAKDIRGQIQAAVAQAQGDAKAVTLKLTLDAGDLKRQVQAAIADAQAGAKVTVQVDADTAKARAAIAAAAKDSKATVGVDADTSAAKRDIDRTRREQERKPFTLKGKFDGKGLSEASSSLFTIGKFASIASYGLGAVQAAGSGIISLVGGLGQVAGGLFAIAASASQAASAAALIPAGIAGGIQVIGTLVAGFAGIGNAVQALQKQEQTAAATSAAAAKQRATGLRAIADAQDALKQAQEQVTVTAQSGARSVAAAQRQVVAAHQAVADAVRNVADTAQAGARRVTDAEQTVVDAQKAVTDAVQHRVDVHEQGAQHIVAAEQSVADAQKAVTDAVQHRVDVHEQGAQRIVAAEQSVVDAADAVARAVRDASDTHAQGLEQVDAAEQSVADTQKQAERDQQALNDARDEARQRLEDYRLQLKGAALDEESASLSVARALQRMQQAHADPRTSDLDKREADLAYKEALQRQQEVSASNADLRAQAADAMKKGVEGADNVVAARDRSTASDQAAVQAQTNLVKARHDAAQADVDAADAVTKARQRQTQAEVDLGKARKEAARANADAAAATVQARGKEAQAERDLGKARKEAARADTDAAAAIVEARRKETRAEQDLTLARRDAARANSDARDAAVKARQDEGLAEDGLTVTRQDAARANARAADAVIKAQRGVKDAQDNLRSATTSTSKAATAAQLAMDGLSPAGQKFARFLAHDVMPVVKSIRAAAQEAMLPGAEAAVRRLLVLAGPIKSIVGGTGRVLGDLMQQAAKVVTSKAWQSDLMTIGKGNARALRAFGTAAISLFNPLKDIVTVVAQPGGLLDRFSQWTTALTANWGKTIAAKRANGSLAAQLDKAGDVIARWYRIVKNILTGIRNIGVEAVPAGDTLTKSFEGSTQDFVKWTRDHKKEIRRFFDGLVPVVESFGRIIKGVAKILGDVMNDPHNLDMMTAIEDKLVPALGRMVKAFQDAGGGSKLVGIIGDLADTVTNLINSGVFGSFVDNLTWLADQLKSISENDKATAVIGALLKVASIVGPLALAAGFLLKIAGGLNKIAKVTGLKKVVSVIYKKATGRGSSPDDPVDPGPAPRSGGGSSTTTRSAPGGKKPRVAGSGSQSQTNRYGPGTRRPTPTPAGGGGGSRRRTRTPAPTPGRGGILRRAGGAVARGAGSVARRSGGRVGGAVIAGGITAAMGGSLSDILLSAGLEAAFGGNGEAADAGKTAAKSGASRAGGLFRRAGGGIARLGGRAGGALARVGGRAGGGLLSRAGGLLGRVGGGRLAGLAGKTLGRGGILGSIAGLATGAIGKRVARGAKRGGARSALGAAISGAGTGAGIGATVGSIVPGVGTAVGAAVGGATGAIVGAVRAIGWTKVKNAVAVAAKGMWGGITAAAKAVGPPLGRFFTGLPGQLARPFKAAGGWISRQWGSISSATTGWFTRTGTSIGKWFSRLPGTLARPFKATGKWFSDHWGAVKDDTSRKFSDAGKAIANWFKGIPRAIGRNATATRTWLRARWDEVRHDVVVKTTAARDAVVGFIKGIPAALRRQWSTARTWMRARWDEVRHDVVVKTGNAKDAVVGFIRGIPDTLRRWWSASRTWLRARWDDVRHDTVVKLGATKDAAVNFVKNLPGNLYRKFVDLRGWWSTQWDNLKTRATSKLAALRDALPQLFRDIKAKFTDGVKLIGGAWNGLKAAVAGPISFVVEHIIDPGIITPIRTIGNALGIDKKHLPPYVHVPKGFGHHAGGVAEREDMAVIPGYTPGRDTGIIGVGGGEAVMRPEWTRAVGPAAVHAMNRIARTSGVQGVKRALGAVPRFMGGFKTGGIAGGAGLGHPKGGLAALIALGKRLQGMGFSVAEGPPPFGPVHHVHAKNSMHYKGLAIDVNHGAGQSAQEQRAIDKIIPLVREYGLHALWRVAGHFNHLHLDTGRFSGVGGGGAEFASSSSGGGGLTDKLRGLLGSLDPRQWIAGKFKNLTAPLTARFGSNMLTNLLGGGVGSLVTGATNRVTGWAKQIGDFAKRTTSDVITGGPSTSKGNIQQTMQAMAAVNGWGDGRQWNALSWIIDHESGWNPNAQNPHSTASGLFQFLDSTWASVGGRKTSNVNEQIRLGLKYIKDRYGDPVNAQKYWQAHGSYATGGIVPQLLSRIAPGLAAGATVQPRPGGTLVRLAERGAAESVVDTGLLNRRMGDLEHLSRLLQAGGGRGPLIGELHLAVGQGATVQEGLGEVMWWLRQQDRGGVYAR